MNSPKISVIIPCYNQAHFLIEALKSVLDQNLKNWECIIINDGSCDHTENVAKDWMKRDTRFKYFGQVNQGLSNARNKGVAEASGEFILPLDADDKISPDYIEKALMEFERNSQLKLVYCKARRFGFENEIWDLPEFSLKRLRLSNIIFCSAIFKRSDWEKIGGYDEKLKNGWEDWEFWISLLKNGGKVKCLDIIGFYYRVKPESMIKDMNKEMREKAFKHINTKHLDFFKINYNSFDDLREIKRSSSINKITDFLRRVFNI